VARNYENILIIKVTEKIPMWSIEDFNKYKDYPEGSGGKKIYDLNSLSFDEYLNKYYAVPDLNRWNYVKSKFVIPLFDGTNWNDYLNFLMQAKPNFSPEREKLLQFLDQIKEDNRFDKELKQFFAFLYSIDFYRELSFEEWISSKSWAHPWHKNETTNARPILEILRHQNGVNYLKEQLGNLSIF
jgi:hypothetical protein